MFQSTEENKSIRVQYAETRLEPIWDCLVSILKDPGNVIPRLEEYTFKSANASKAREKMLQCEKQIEHITGQRGRVVRVFMDGGIDEAEYKAQLDDCNSRILEHQNQKVKFQQMLVKKEERADRDEVLKKLYAQVKARLETASYDDKQFILRLFVERINLFHLQNYAEVFFRFPASVNMKRDENTKVVSQPTDLRLVLHVKTLSERERRLDIHMSNLNRMYRKKGT